MVRLSPTWFDEISVQSSYIFTARTKKFSKTVGLYYCERVSDKMSDTGSEIESFYKGRSVFITGASGFVGKVLLEKLLRSCPGIAVVYVLMRPKRGSDVRTRMQELLNSKVLHIFIIIYFKKRKNLEAQATFGAYSPTAA